jgi:glycerol-3-phosphate dehydrogenase
VVATRCEVVEVTHEHGRATGVVVRDTIDDRRIEVRASTVVNAAGVWLDRIRQLDEGTDPGSIRPAKGVHVTVPWERLRVEVAVVIPVPKDRRSLFVVPWGRLEDGTYRYAYVGTTDTDDGADLDDPQCSAVDLEYVLRALNHSFAPADGALTIHDVTGVWAGLRPLVTGSGTGRTADLSRRHAVTTSEHGVVAVAGGKLTTYRQMAADTVDEVMRRLGRRGRSRTARHPLVGGRGYRSPGADASPLDRHLGARYGTEAPLVQALLREDPSLAAPLVPGLPYVRAEAVHAVRHEMALTLDDVLLRRTRAHLFDRDGALAAAPAIAQLLATELGWDEAETDRQVAAYAERCRREVDAAATVTGTPR